MLKILAFAGSSRKESFNKKLLKIAVLGVKEQGGYVTLIDLVDYPMPIFNQDLEQEQGIPENARKLKQLMVEHNAFIIASPEYNSTFSPLLKNVIDWASRAESESQIPSSLNCCITTLISPPLSDTILSSPAQTSKEPLWLF